MNSNQTSWQAGFTLIETLVYLALYATIVLGMLSAVYSMIESSAHNETTAMVEEEGDFLISKINTVLSGAISIQSPINSGDMLSVIESDGSNDIITSDASGIRLQEGDSAFQTLNNTNVTVSNLIFIHTNTGDTGIDLENVSASFSLDATTSDGHVLRANFSILKYLHL